MKKDTLKIKIDRDGAHTYVSAIHGRNHRHHTGLSVRNADATLACDAINDLDIADLPELSGGCTLSALLEILKNHDYEMSEVTLTKSK